MNKEKKISCDYLQSKYAILLKDFISLDLQLKSCYWYHFVMIGSLRKACHLLYIIGDIGQMQQKYRNILLHKKNSWEQSTSYNNLPHLTFLHSIISNLTKYSDMNLIHSLQIGLREELVDRRHNLRWPSSDKFSESVFSISLTLRIVLKHTSLPVRFVYPKNQFNITHSSHYSIFIFIHI